MDIQISNVTKTDSAKYVQATCGKVSAFVAFSNHGVQVVCHNAAHKVWRGSGKHFDSADEAINNYRSGEMKAIISAAAAA